MTMRTRTSRATFWAALSAALLLSWPETSFAVDTATRAAARDLGMEGVEAYERGDYLKAKERLERAYKVLPLPSLALWSARALEKNGLLLDASERYLEATRLSTEGAGDPQVQIDAQAEAEEEREALRDRIPKVIVDIQGAPGEEVEVTIDGALVASALYGAGRPSNPGKLEVVARWGSRKISRQVIVKEGDEKKITLTFEGAAAPSPAPVGRPENGGAPAPQKEAQTQTTGASASPPDMAPRKGGSGQKVVGWIGVGVGSAGLVFGTITGFLAMQKNDKLSANCPDRVCGPDSKVDRWMYNNFRIMSSAGLIAGGVVAATGVTLLVTAPKNESSAFVSPYVGLSSAGLKGAF